jgi:hypothetical protein
MDATGTASAVAAIGFVWAVGREALRRVEAVRTRAREAELEAEGYRRRARELRELAARREAVAGLERLPGIGWVGHDSCQEIRSCGGCLGLSAAEVTARAPARPDRVPDYVPEHVLGQVVRGLIDERRVTP